MITSTPPTLVVVFSFVWFRICPVKLIYVLFLHVPKLNPLFLSASHFFVQFTIFSCKPIFPFFPRSKTRRPTTDARFQFSVLSLKDSSSSCYHFSLSISLSLSKHTMRSSSPRSLMANPNGLGRCQGRNFRHLLQSGSGLGLR